jgi:putative hydrolase of HD superfamily
VVFVDVDAVLGVLLQSYHLKRTLRTGWVMRGVPDAESVADHSFGVAFVSLLLADLVDQPLDRAKVLTIALLHDLPESVTGDIPSPAMRYFPPDAKRKAENEIVEALLDDVPSAEQWRAWWMEFEEGASVEARIVHDADRLDMLIQAYVYQQTTGNHWLDEFWPATGATFEFDVSRDLYGALRALVDW